MLPEVRACFHQRSVARLVDGRGTLVAKPQLDTLSGCGRVVPVPVPVPVSMSAAIRAPHLIILVRAMCMGAFEVNSSTACGRVSDSSDACKRNVLAIPLID